MSEITILNQIVESEKSNDVKVEELKTFLHRYKQVSKPKVDWKLVAGHLDMSIFEFILDNLNDEKIAKFGQSLSSELFTKFGLDRTISDNRTDN
tara:strand:- start:675 stop:956 length:282 start_codon:yes stop_codon:yes gene_type:complete